MRLRRCWGRWEELRTSSPPNKKNADCGKTQIARQLRRYTAINHLLIYVCKLRRWFSCVPCICRTLCVFFNVDRRPSTVNRRQSDVFFNTRAVGTPQLTHLWWLLVALARQSVQAHSALAYSQLFQFSIPFLPFLLFLLFYRPHPPSAPSPNLGEGVHGAVHTISTTPPDLLLGGAAERNYDHPSHPPLS